jgi:tagatose-6-phosphate ketose/aldose isomerase
MTHSLWSKLLQTDASVQEHEGYVHTLREIRQQPATLLDTCERTLARANNLRRCLEGVQSIVLTGSGSSEYAGACVTVPLEQGLGIVTQSIASGSLLTHGASALPPLRPALLVSLARSGDSPESVAAIKLMLNNAGETRHLAITCNAAGQLATCFQGEPRVAALTLNERTNDRSLVMTSSFTSLALAARGLALLTAPDRFRALSRALSSIVQSLLDGYFDVLASAADLQFERALFLGTGSNAAAAREASLKMLEMTAGRVATLAETFLGLRHGPMSFINEGTIVVCFLASEARARAYEIDLIRELNRKQLSAIKVIAGEEIPPGLLGARDIAVECPGLSSLGREDACIVHVVIGQLLAFFRCLKEGLRPDSPSESGVISRVVESFPLHLEGALR